MVGASPPGIPHIVLYTLGNYTHPSTKHSLGQYVIPHLLQYLNLPSERDFMELERKHDCWIGSAVTKFPSNAASEMMSSEEGRFRLTIAKPRILMNLNGRPVPFLLRSLSNHTGTQPPILLALHDNLTIPPLTVGKARFNVSSQGHGGLTSIESTLKSKEFWRLGLGVGRNDSQGVVGWVMSGLSRDEKLFWEGEGVRRIVREIQGLLGKTKDGRPMDMGGGKSKKKKNKVEVVNPGPPGR